MMNISKRRAIAELKQKISGKRNDGFGAYTGEIFGSKDEGKYVKLSRLDEIDEYNKFTLG